MSQKRIKSKALQMARLRFLVADNERLKGKAASLERQLREASTWLNDQAGEGGEPWPICLPTRSR